MSLLDKAQTLLRRFRAGEEFDEDSMYSRRHDGSLSGYHPNVGRMSPQDPATPADQPYDAYSQPPSYAAQEPVMQGQMPVQPQAEYTFQQNYQPLWNPPEQAYQQADYRTGYQPHFQQPPMPANQPGSPIMGYQPPFPPQQPAQPIPDNISYMPGGVIGSDGKEYLHTVRIAQITGVPDCYTLMRSMRNNETVIVNLDMVPDNSEIDRCLDLLFGASYALQCQFNLVSSRNIYLLTPATIQVENVENLRQRSEYEADNRWPDPGNLAYRQRVAAREQNAYNGYSGFGQSNFAPSYQSYGMGRRNGTRNTVEYTDFGGFPSAGRY